MLITKEALGLMFWKKLEKIFMALTLRTLHSVVPESFPMAVSTVDPVGSCVDTGSGHDTGPSGAVQHVIGPHSAGD